MSYFNYGETPKTIGAFKEKEHGHWFEYRETSDEWALEQGLTHEIAVADGKRYAKVKKTVAYVAIDEDDYGKAIIEKWKIAQHRVYLS